MYGCVGVLVIVAAAETLLVVRQGKLPTWLQDMAGQEPPPALQGEEDGRVAAADRRGTEVEEPAKKEAETTATPEVAAPRAEAEDLVSAETAYKRGDYATVLQLMRPLAEGGNAQNEANGESHDR